MRKVTLGILLGFTLVRFAGAQASKSTGIKPAVKAESFHFSRMNLAKSAQFMVTTTLAPRGGTAKTHVFKVAVNGAKGRLDYKEDTLGEVRLLVNEKGTFFFIPANKAAQKMNVGVEDGLNTVFSQASAVLAGAQRSGTATVSGIVCDVYKNPKSSSVVYLGTTPGFRLPVKMEIRNSGGAQTMQASNIKLNTAIPDTYFALPAGTQIIESQGGPSGLPGSK